MRCSLTENIPDGLGISGYFVRQGFTISVPKDVLSLSWLEFSTDISNSYHRKLYTYEKSDLENGVEQYGKTVRLHLSEFVC